MLHAINAANETLCILAVFSWINNTNSTHFVIAVFCIYIHMQAHDLSSNLALIGHSFVIQTSLFPRFRYSVLFVWKTRTSHYSENVKNTLTQCFLSFWLNLT